MKALGWHINRWAAAPAIDAFPPDPDAEDDRKKRRRVRTGAIVLRALAQHQSLGKLSQTKVGSSILTRDFLAGVLPTPGDILPAFRRLWALSDEHLTSIFAIGPVVEFDPLFLTVPMFVEAFITKLAARQERERQNASGREVLAKAQRRYLKYLKTFIVLLQPVRFSSLDMYVRNALTDGSGSHSSPSPLPTSTIAASSSTRSINSLGGSNSPSKARSTSRREKACSSLPALTLTTSAGTAGPLPSPGLQTS